MTQKETAEKVKLIYDVATELAQSEIPVVRQRSEAIMGLLRELMITLVDEG